MDNKIYNKLISKRKKVFWSQFAIIQGNKLSH